MYTNIQIESDCEYHHRSTTTDRLCVYNHISTARDRLCLYNHTSTARDRLSVYNHTRTARDEQCLYNHTSTAAIRLCVFNHTSTAAVTHFVYHNSGKVPSLFAHQGRFVFFVCNLITFVYCLSCHSNLYLMWNWSALFKYNKLIPNNIHRQFSKSFSHNFYCKIIKIILISWAIMLIANTLKWRDASVWSLFAHQSW